QLEGVDLLARDRTLAALVEHRGLREAGEARERDVLEDGLVEQQPLALALFGREADARRDGVPYRSAAQLGAPHGHRSARRLACAVDGLDDLRSAGAHEARESDDLARP